ncbi:M3 family metallopeptidase [Peribacillus muralis]|uniref:M3 family metallopeptidase n=1 Tax=Peribacillus muralis TaxID=264697 RepID=UPI003D04DB9E
MKYLATLISKEDRIKRYIDEMNAIETIYEYGGRLPASLNNMEKIHKDIGNLDSIRKKILSIIELLPLNESMNKERKDLVIIRKALKKLEDEAKTQEIKELVSREEQLVGQYYEVYQKVYEGLGKISGKSSERDPWLEKTAFVLTFGNEINNTMNELIQVRNKLATKKGYMSFQSYCEATQDRTSFEKGEFDDWKEALSNSLIPVIQRLYRRNADKLGHECVYPWKLDELELLDFAEEIDATEYVQEIIESIADFDQSFSNYVKDLWEEGFIDLGRRAGKVDFGYCLELPFSRKSYVSIFPTGTIFDVFYLIHELGHVFHYYCKKDLPHSSMRNCNNEINELAAHVFEITLIFHMFQKSPKILRTYMSQLVISIPFNIAVHEFQEELYKNEHQLEESKEILFFTILKKYTHCTVETRGYEKGVASIWLLNEQVFSSPYYYLEYSFAKLSAIHYIGVMLRETKKLEFKEKFRQILKIGNKLHNRDIFKKAVGSSLLLGKSELEYLSKFVENILNIE